MSEKRLRRLAANYAATDEAFIDALVAMATDRTRGWWEEYRGSLPTPFLDLAELEHHASCRWDVDFLHIPGLLQSEDYARALFSYVNPEFPTSEVESWVEHRMKRRVIIERPDPIPYETVIHEAALRIRVGDQTAARAQLARVLELSEADHVTVRVIPFDLNGFGGAGSAMVYAVAPSRSWTPWYATAPTAPFSLTPRPSSIAIEPSSVGWRRCHLSPCVRVTSSTGWRRSCDCMITPGIWQKSSFSGAARAMPAWRSPIATRV